MSKTGGQSKKLVAERDKNAEHGGGYMGITGKTKLVGLLGWPVGHTLSPAIQNAAFQAAGLDYAYVPLAVRPADLPQAVNGLRALGFAGANVTIPHKTAVIPLLDSLGKDAARAGAVNTIIVADGRLNGHNTDIQGFLAPLRGSVPLAGQTVVVFGAGGAARAVLVALELAGAAETIIAGRDRKKVEALAASFKTAVPCLLKDSEMASHLGRASLVVNSTPLGMAPYEDEMVRLDWASINKAAIIYDLIYNPPETRLLREAARHGFRVVSGMEMLVEQGALAFTLWTGLEAPREVMAAALREALRRRERGGWIDA